MSQQADFDGLFEMLGLDELDPAQTCEATFVPVPGAKGGSAPREVAAAPASLTGTLPRLKLESPDAAKLNPDQAELQPLTVIGEGGMGRVLLARQSSLSRDVAVKVLRPDSVSEGVADALIHEARTTGGLEHPSVIPIYALARDSAGLPAVVMKRVEGVAWRELVHDARHPAWAKLAPDRDRLAFHVEVLAQVCNAVAHAHQRGVLHRDVKPANVLLGELGEVYLADWGVALKKSEAGSTPTRLVGTPAYLAPEMVTGDARMVDERTDVFLLGATLYELLTGAPPHVGTGLREVLRHAFECPEPALFPDAPPLLAAACKKAMAADPGKRFTSATGLRDELRRWLQHRGATELAAAARRRLEQLEAMSALTTDTAEQRRWYTLVSECRFGFKQALESSPDHAEARDGLRRCLETAVRHELDRGAAASAAAFLAELEHPPKQLAADLRALEQKDAERLKAQAEMERLSHELDLDVASRQRTLTMMSVAGVIAVMVTTLSFVQSRARVEAEFGTWFRMVPLAVTTLIWVIAATLGRRSLFSNRINRQLMGLMGTGLVGSLVHRAFSVVLGVSAHGALAMDAVLFAVLCAFAMLTVHRGFFGSVLCFLAGALGSALFPDVAVGIFGGCSAAAITVAALVVWRSGKTAPLA